MKQSLLKKAAFQSLALMLAVVTLSYALQQYHAITIEASDKYKEEDFYASASDIETMGNNSNAGIQSEQPEPTQKLQLSELDQLLTLADPEIIQNLNSDYLIIKKPEGRELSLSLEDIYINKSIRLTLTGRSMEAVTSDMILRVRDGQLYAGDPVFQEIVTVEINEDDGSSEEIITKDFGEDISHGIAITAMQDTVTSKNLIEIWVTLDSVYTYTIYEDLNYYFIDIRKPSEVFDRILVIDAGHGGKDAGALSPGEEYYEKNINLGILLSLKELLDRENIKVYYTRTGDDKVFLRPRVELANAVDCDYFISIHCNSNLSSSPNGTEVLYYNNEFKGVAAYDLASLFSEEITKTIPLKNKGPVQKHYEDIFIMDKSQVPMILIEVGYLSNGRDLDYLIKAENQKEVALGIYNGILRAYEELPVTD